MERETIDDAPLSKKTLDDMIHDNYSYFLEKVQLHY